MTVKNKKETVVLKAMDSLYLEPNEGRELINNTNKTATMLVVVSNP